jgi:hypothetical protein
VSPDDWEDAFDVEAERRAAAIEDRYNRDHEQREQFA